MPGFFYFVPGPKLTVERLSEIGFPFARDAGLPGNTLAAGPDGKAGVMFTLKAFSDHPAYKPDAQKWRPCSTGDGAWWLAYETDRKPTPADLLRDGVRDGHIVKDTEGNAWCVPVVRDHIGACRLDHVYGLSLEGRTERELAGGVDAVELWQLAQKVFTILILRQGGKFTISDAWRTCELAIRSSYYAGKDELAILGTISDHVMRDITHAVADYPKLKEITDEINRIAEQKKSTDRTDKKSISASADSQSPSSTCGVAE